MRNLKRALSLAMASVMLMGMMVVGTNAASYPDVDSQNNLEAIEVLKMVGIMTGDENGNFNPDQKVTRNEMAVVMVNLLGLKPGGNTPFTDVAAWAQPYVAACYNNGIIAGISATEFGGSSDVTAVQSGLMIMKALGYFGYAGEFGDDWKLSTVRQADKINLYDGINAYTDQSMTRNEVAQMVLNALECTIQVVTEQGGVNVDGNGISVSVKPTYTYTAAANNSGKDYLGRNGGPAPAVLDRTMQLCEKLYNNNLKKDNTSTTDDFGRPSTRWTYGNDNIVTPKAPDLTYTVEVKGKDIFADLGRASVINANIEIFRNNEDLTGVAPFTTFAIASGNNDKIGAKGTVMEVYYNNDNLSATTATIVMVDTYLAQASNDFDEDDQEVSVKIFSTLATSAELSADDFAVANVEKDDYLLVNITFDGDVKAVSFPEIMEDVTVRTARPDDYVELTDRTKYEYSAVSKASAAALGQSLMAGAGYELNDDGYNLYLDANGYVVGVKGYDAGVKLDDYIFITAVNNNGFDGIAKAVFSDGTTKTITVDKLGTATINAGNIAANVNIMEFYKFKTDKDGNYELTTIPASGAKVNQDNDTSAIVSGSANPLGTGNPAGNANTVFIAKDTVYTGTKNAPEVASGAVYYLFNDDNALMLVYTASQGSTKTKSNDLVYILNVTPAVAKDGDDTYYIYNAIVDGVKTTLEANDEGAALTGGKGVYKLATFTDGRANLTGNQITTTAGLVVVQTAVAANTSFKDGTLILNTQGFLLADNVKILTIDGNTVKAIGENAVEKAVKDGFVNAYLIKDSDTNDDIVTIFLSK